ncbi:hypothetical protein GOQ29_12040 [Clostridium sp. D2Q-14]|uniref:hypothetical protein n=1 Tax=Anaeromonas gelatinilytica TaxID=2683194 RepID=UPI00193B9059|nr:hypothetical protein [Anaeromonas gelatinilytica]MBS4536347.1 hypothetical protein [Anaeromonas gelatinilytica]
MYPLKTYYKKTGLFNDIPLRVPSRTINDKENFYPFVLYFNSNKGFSQYINQDVELSIIYNFGNFSSNKKYSNYFNSNSDYYSSFYGVYGIKTNDGTPFGFNQDDIDIDLLSKMPEYDQKYLVLPSIGLLPKNVTFKYKIKNIKENINYIDSNNWIKVDSIIKTNSPLHKYKKHHNGYIQYGIPPESNNIKEDYPIIDLYGRMYIKFFEEYDSTIVFYILANDKSTVNKIDKYILSNSYINKNK